LGIGLVFTHTHLRRHFAPAASSARRHVMNCESAQNTSAHPFVTRTISRETISIASLEMCPKPKFSIDVPL
jgi:hypothetical protein